MSGDVTVAARMVIGAMLDGKLSMPADPGTLGKYAECYSEMARAFERGGPDAARMVYVTYAERDADHAALRAADPEPPRKVLTAAEILSMEFPPPTWLVPDLLPTGKVDLAGRPKLGKSWLALQIAVGVSTGGMVFDRQVERAPVLYLALEDNRRRLQARLRKQHAPPTSDLHLATEWAIFSRGGVADILESVNRYGHKLVVVDTISRALGGADQMDAAEMNVTMGSLQRFAMERDICLLCVDHHRKSAGSGEGDPVDDIMGATAKAGVSDAVMGLYRARGQQDATLKIVGRDVDDQELAIRFDQETGCWQKLGDAGGVKAGSVQASILTCLEAYGGEATSTDVARALGKLLPNIHVEMQELCAKGLVERLDRPGKEVPYRLTPKAFKV